MGYGGILNRESVEKGAVVANYPVADGYSINKGDVVDVVNGEVVSKVLPIISSPTTKDFSLSGIVEPAFYFRSSKNYYLTAFGDLNRSGSYMARGYYNNSYFDTTGNDILNVYSNAYAVDGKNLKFIVGATDQSVTSPQYLVFSNTGILLQKYTISGTIETKTIACCESLDDENAFWFFGKDRSGPGEGVSLYAQMAYIEHDSNGTQTKKISSYVYVGSALESFGVIGMSPLSNSRAVVFFTQNNNEAFYLIVELNRQESKIEVVTQKTPIGEILYANDAKYYFRILYEENLKRVTVVYNPHQNAKSFTIFTFKEDNNALVKKKIELTPKQDNYLYYIFSVQNIGENKYIIYFKTSPSPHKFYVTYFELTQNGDLINSNTTFLEEQYQFFEKNTVNLGLTTYFPDDNSIYFVNAQSFTSNTLTTVITKTKLLPNGMIGDSITYISTQAIALNSGISGQNIDIIYSGAVEYEASKDTKIESNGVLGYVPVENVLDVIPWYFSNLGLKATTGSYTGTGEYGKDHPVKITLPFEPMLFFIAIKNGGHRFGDGDSAYWWKGNTELMYINSNVDIQVIKNTISWFDSSNASNQFNATRALYTYFALGY